MVYLISSLHIPNYYLQYQTHNSLRPIMSIQHKIYDKSCQADANPMSFHAKGNLCKIKNEG